jgi:hypothetical protein
LIARFALALALALGPHVAWGCAACVDAARADRGFNWAFVGLMMAPFAVAAGLAGALASGRAWHDAQRGPRRAATEPPAADDARPIAGDGRDGD